MAGKTVRTRTAVRERSPYSLPDVPDETLDDLLRANGTEPPSPLEEISGPFYDTAGLRVWLGVTRQALHERVKAKKLLGMQTGNRTWVYPAWQFTPNRKTIPTWLTYS